MQINWRYLRATANLAAMISFAMRAKLSQPNHLAFRCSGEFVVCVFHGLLAAQLTLQMNAIRTIAELLLFLFYF